MQLGDYFKDINPKYKKYFFTGVNFNSLKIKKDNIFFAIEGNNIDGNRYIKDAIKRGSRIIVSKSNLRGVKDKVLYINSKNIRKSLAETAYKIYKDKPKNLIAVTGTNGKSSIADFYFQILRLNKKKVASIGTLGIKTVKKKINLINTTLNPVDLSKYLKKLKESKIENVILEASSHGLSQNRLDGLLFKSGIFTNLSHDHLDYHKNLNKYLKSKLYLFEQLIEKKGNIISDQDIPQYKKLKLISKKKRLNLYTISNYLGSLKLISHTFDDESQIIEIRYKDQIYKVKINLIGKIQIKNILMAIIAAQRSNVSFKKIIKTIGKVKPVSGRMEKIGVIKNKSKVILDYAHTPDALKISLKNLKDQFKGKKIFLVFGCGGERDKKKRAIMGKIANSFCHKIYLTDDNPRNESPRKIRVEVKKYIKKNKLCEISKRETAIKKAVMKLNTGDILVVAGRGHENIQDYGNKKLFLSDKDIILKAIKNKNKKLSINLKINIINEQSNHNHLIIKKTINKASINSKEIKKNDIFFAIRGKYKDGNLYLKEAFRKKASLAVVSKIDKKINPIKQIKVNETLSFLTNCSSTLRENLSSKIIAITGSCGKTSLKDLLSKTLQKFYKVSSSRKSYNNKFGVPLSLFNLNQNDDFGVLEVGMDKKGEIDFLSKIIKPDVGIITNISHAHSKNFSNITQIALAKAEIMNNIKENGSVILNADDKFFNLHKKIAKKKKLKIFSFGVKNKNSDIKLDKIVKYKEKFKLIVKVNEKVLYFFIPNNYENNIYNILATLVIMNLYLDLSKISKNIFSDFNIPEGRGDISKIKFGNKKFFLVDESYNSNPLSLNSAIQNFEKINVKKEKKHIILGDMLELGHHSKKLHILASKIINTTSVFKVNVFGKYILETYKKIDRNKKGLILKDISQIINLIKRNINNNDYLMIKGSNSTGLNKIVFNLKKGRINAL